MAQPIALAHTHEREAIIDALYRVVIGLDTNDWPLFESGWAGKDVVFEMNGNPSNGLDAIRDSIFTHIGPLDTTHFINNQRVDAQEGAKTAYLTAYALAQHYKTGEGIDPATKRLLSGSMYFIDLEKDGKDGLWKIKKWSMKIIWVEGDMSIVMPS